MPTIVVRILAAFLFTLVAGVAAPAPLACACSCAEVDTDQAMRNASAVFDGTVIEKSQPTTGSSAELIGYTIEVARVYQGSVPATVVVRSAASSASCGAELTGQVTVFAQGPAENLSTTLCSAPFTIDRSRLGAGYPPEAAPLPTSTPEPATTEGPDTGPLVVAGVAVAGILALAGAVIWIVRRPRS